MGERLQQHCDGGGGCAAPADATRLPEPEPSLYSTMRVQVWHAVDDRPNDQITFMYAPIVKTLVSGFALFANVSHHILSGSRLQQTRGHAIAASLVAGDVLLHVGHRRMELHPWAQLQSRGVRTVFYITDPEMLCGPESAPVREVWSYTRRVLECAQPRMVHLASNVRRSAAMTYRYVPPGFLGQDDGNRRSGIHRTGRAPPASPAPPPAPILSFLGHPTYHRLGRKRCLGELGVALGSQLRLAPSIWSGADFERWWREAGGSDAVHLSLHKYGIHTPNTSCAERCCNDPSQPFESVRASLLLSRGACVLAARSFRWDEREYKGLVTFADLPDGLLAAFGKLASTPRDDVSRRDVAFRFQERFSPRLLFERAGVYTGDFKLISREFARSDIRRTN